jgi:urea transport system ATP-binding protein
MLTLSKINVSIGGSRILRDVSLTVPMNQVVCLMGRNGVGKTTTLKTITGLLQPTSGQILWNGKDITRLRSDQRARGGIGYVPQGRDIFPNMTVWENLKIGLVANGRKANGQLERIYGLFPVLKEMLERKGGVLSGGQQQQLAIARALLTDPQILILDEPTEGIQPNIIDQIGDAIRMLRSEGTMGILLVEQYLDFAQSLGDSFTILDRGSVVAQGSIKDLDNDTIKNHLMV